MKHGEVAMENQAKEVDLYSVLWISYLDLHPWQNEKDACSSYCKAMAFLLTLLKFEGLSGEKSVVLSPSVPRATLKMYKYKLMELMTAFP